MFNYKKQINNGGSTKMIPLDYKTVIECKDYFFKNKKINEMSPKKKN